jgi:hypothetical protein
MMEENMTARTIYREKYYICGEYLDVYIFPVFPGPRHRGKKAKPTTETQAKLNERHANDRLVRLLNTNFTPNDMEVVFTYAVNPESDEQAKKDIQNLIRRLKRLRAKLGLSELKYIAVTEKSSKGRYHHHVTISGGVDRDIVEKLWGFGRANSKRLQFGENGVAGLAHYIVKSPIFSKRWCASKNLIDPEPRTNDSRIRSRRRAAELARDPEDREPWEKLYPEYHLAEAVPFSNDTNGGIYIFARLYRKDGKFIQPRRKRKKEQNA